MTNERNTSVLAFQRFSIYNLYITGHLKTSPWVLGVLSNNYRQRSCKKTNKQFLSTIFLKNSHHSGLRLYLLTYVKSNIPILLLPVSNVSHVI